MLNPDHINFGLGFFKSFTISFRIPVTFTRLASVFLHVVIVVVRSSRMAPSFLRVVFALIVIEIVLDSVTSSSPLRGFLETCVVFPVPSCCDSLRGFLASLAFTLFTLGVFPVNASSRNRSSRNFSTSSPCDFQVTYLSEEGN